MMHTIKLEVRDSVFEKVIYFLQNLPSSEVTILEDKKSDAETNHDEKSEINAYSNHTANTIDEWKEISEDDIWK